ncbi:MAG: hypothetical protein RLZZ213_1461 [Cyanobacteriota bacterium]
MSIRFVKLYTAGHAHRVADLAEAIGRVLGLDASTMEGLRISALVHDIGKIAIPAELLTKPTALSVWEMALIKSHGEVGYEVLSEIDFPWPVAKAVHQHHEVSMAAATFKALRVTPSFSRPGFWLWPTP